jgi:HAD superfamily hydrolase (TIGR01509 family)
VTETPRRVPLQAAVFDLDGTLIDSLPLTFRAFRSALGPILGREPTDREIYARFGPADHEIVAAMVRPDQAPKAIERLMAAYADGAADVLLYEGIREMLDGLRKSGLRLAVCTGRGRPSTDLLLARLGIAGWFETVVTGEEVPLPKPAPDGIRETARRLGVPPEVVLYTGDSIKDVDAGLAAGALTVAALWAGTEEETNEFARADARARTPMDVVRIAAGVIP